jgi:hypothetical protein
LYIQINSGLNREGEIEMKHNKLLGIIALVVVIGFSMVGCGGDNGGTTGTTGELTIVGFDDYNGQYAVAVCNDYSLDKSFLAAAGFNEDGTLVDAVKISSGQAALKVWEIKNDNALSYNGNDTLSFNVLIYDHTPIVYNYSFDNQYIALKQVIGVFSDGVASGEIYVPSALTNLSDTRFNGTFRQIYTTGDFGSTIWVFDGTNKAKYTITTSTFDQEIRLENGHLWRRLWNNRFSAWSDEGAYSFSEDENSLTIGYATYTRQD